MRGQAMYLSGDSFCWHGEERGSLPRTGKFLVREASTESGP